MGSAESETHRCGRFDGFREMLNPSYGSYQYFTKIPSFPRKREPSVASVRAVTLGPRFREGDYNLLKLAVTFGSGHSGQVLSTRSPASLGSR